MNERGYPFLFIHHDTVMHSVAKKKLHKEQDQGLCCYCAQQDIAMYTVVR